MELKTKEIITPSRHNTQQTDYHTTKPCKLCTQKTVKGNIENNLDQELDTHVHASQYFCIDCTYYLCKSCKEEHSSIPLFKQHAFVHITSESPRVVHEYIQGCALHSGEAFLYNCQESCCHTNVCSICVFTNHMHHNVIPLSDKNKEYIKAQLKLIGDKTEKLDSKIRCLEQTDLEMKQRNVDISKTFQENIMSTCSNRSDIEEDITSLLAKVEIEQGNKLKELNENREVCLAKRKDIQSMIDDCELFLNMQADTHKNFKCILNQICFMGKIEKFLENGDATVSHMQMCPHVGNHLGSLNSDPCISNDTMSGQVISPQPYTANQSCFKQDPVSHLGSSTNRLYPQLQEIQNVPVTKKRRDFVKSVSFSDQDPLTFDHNENDPKKQIPRKLKTTEINSQKRNAKMTRSKSLPIQNTNTKSHPQLSRSKSESCKSDLSNNESPLVLTRHRKVSKSEDSMSPDKFTFGGFLMFNVLGHMVANSKASKKSERTSYMVDGYPRTSMYD